MIGTVMVTPFAANAGLGEPFPWSGAYPWSGVGIAMQAWVLFLLALRVRPRIAVETLTITLLLGLACGASTPWRSAHDIRLAIAALVLTVVVGVPCAASWWSVRSWSCRRSSPPRSVPGAPCWRNATASHASCTMWSPTTCRSSPSRRRSSRTWSRTRPTNCGRTPRASAATRSTRSPNCVGCSAYCAPRTPCPRPRGTPRSPRWTGWTNWSATRAAPVSRSPPRPPGSRARCRRASSCRRSASCRRH